MSQQAEREIVADYRQHVEGERELADWDRLDPDGTVRRHYNVPMVYIREVTQEEYLQQNPQVRGRLHPAERFFWEVSVD